MRKKRLIWNLITEYGSRLCTIICAFILPKLILETYGSETNGLISSITQFLSIIYLTDMGFNVVVQSALYKPLSNNDDEEISRILVSATKFFRIIGGLLVVYTIFLCIFYPLVVENYFDRLYIVMLIIILSSGSIVQYLFGIVRAQLLCADQKIYIVSITTAATTLLNTMLCYLLIKIDVSIHLVKLATAVCFLINPIVYSLYIKKHYRISWRIKYDTEPIKQKWIGISQHFANYVFRNTDVVVLTIISNIKNVSIYSVYNLVLNGINQILSTFGNAIQPLLGEFWAKGEDDNFSNAFRMYENTMHTVGTFVYGCTLSLIGPFIRVYTFGVSDANYDVPLFAFTITLSAFFQFYCTPYSIVINTIGHFKESRDNYIKVAILNLFISIIAVRYFGLVGVAVGTLISSIYKTLWQGMYLYKEVIGRNIQSLFLDIIKNNLILTLGGLACLFVGLDNVSYLSWVVLAVKSVIIWFSVLLFVNLIIDRKSMKLFLETIRNITKSRVSVK